MEHPTPSSLGRARRQSPMIEGVQAGVKRIFYGVRTIEPTDETPGKYKIESDHGYVDIEFSMGTFYIAKVFVDPEFRNNREGWYLLDCAYELAKKLGAINITAMFVGGQGQLLFESYFGTNEYTYKDGPGMSFDFSMDKNSRTV